MADVIQELGHLAELAKRDPQHRFDRLFRLLRQPAFLALAKQRIAGNHGARTPGVDGRTLADETTEEITRLSEELATGTYRPQPVRRVYIPKRSGNKLRPLGIPASRDKIVQAGVALILEALYEPIFRDCSHGFRPQRSTITALRRVSSAYRAGATWIIEGDITDCFGSLPHGVILNCLRKRIKDERFIDLIRRMLQAGVMEQGSYSPTYSGAPQGGVASPILMNIVMHELDDWLETQMGLNPPVETPQETNARSNPEYMRLHYRLTVLKRSLDGKRPMPKGRTAEELQRELRETLRLRRLQPRCLPRRRIYYSRYADDFLVVLCNTSKEEARQLKTAIAEWMRANLGLTLNPDKTHITHWRDHLRFLGYDLQGCSNPNGTHWLRLSVPAEAVRKVVARVKRATAYPQAPAYDVFSNVNAVVRGWTNYYRYAHDNNAIGGKLSMVIFWRTVHYLAQKHRRSLAKTMHGHYGRDPTTGCQGLYIYKPGQPPTPEHRYFIWHKTPKRLSIGLPSAAAVQDRPAYLDERWAAGHSQAQRKSSWAVAGGKCQQCGASGVTLFVHHPNHLNKAKRVARGYGHVAASGLAQKTILLCRACHLAYHQGDFHQQRGQHAAGKPDAA
jgi:group II intron reverse transcriptase/maturase